MYYGISSQTVSELQDLPIIAYACASLVYITLVKTYDVSQEAI